MFLNTYILDPTLDTWNLTTAGGDCYYLGSQYLLCSVFSISGPLPLQFQIKMFFRSFLITSVTLSATSGLIARTDCKSTVSVIEVYLKDTLFPTTSDIGTQ